MPPLVVNLATAQCAMGTSPTPLKVIPSSMVNGVNQPAATIMDFKPMVNITPFGPCKSPAFPATASATAAASGVLTPMPCIPLTTSPWIPGSPTVLIGNMPALNSSSTLICNWGGTITITNPGQTTIIVP